MAIDAAVDSAALDTRLLQIAEAIRTKNGQSDTYTLERMPLAVQQADTTGYGKLPAYWQSAVDNTITALRNLAADGSTVPLFAFFSDCHVRPGSTTPNPGHTGVLAAMVMNAAQVPYAMCCGDSARSDGNGLSSETEMAQSLIAADNNLAPIGWYRLLQTQGNHDGSWGTSGSKTYAYQMTPAKLYDHIYRKQAAAGNHVFGGDDNSFFYVDDTANKVRFILLNSLWCRISTNDDGTAAYSRQHYFGYGQAQLDWLANTALQVPAGWIVVLGTHVPPLAEYADVTRDYALLRGILTAYANRSSYSGSYTANTSRGEGDWANVSVSVDFSSAVGLIAGFFCGHCHKDQIVTGDLPFPVITITADADLSYDDSEADRVAGTVNEHAIDFVSFHKSAQTFMLTRLGVGASRVCTFDGSLLYAITNRLTHVTTSNTTQTAEKGAAYTAVLTPESGYENLTVTVTMGGSDVTSSVYSNGTVSISSVTGDVVITASAEVKPDYTNLADPSSADWANDSRLSSSGSVKTCTGAVVTNWIDCKRGDVLRIRGIDLTSKTNSGNTEAPYLQVTYTDAVSEAVDINTYESGFTVENDVTTFLVYALDGQNQSSTSYHDEVQKIRFSGLLTAASADKVVITKNEAI